MTTKRELTVPATQFKAQCLALMDRVQRGSLRVTVTKRGKPVARLVPIESAAVKLFGSLPVTIAGDIVGPVDETWEAER